MQGVETIPEEDRQELLSEIEKVVAKNKIRVTPELFHFKANKGGVLLPVMVNLAALLVLGLGLLGLYLFFQREESGLEESFAAVASVEGRLIDEVRREAEARMEEKEQEIGAIESQMEEIARERNALEANMENQIQEREELLRAELEQEMEELRTRLAAEGVSESDIAAEVEKLEAERMAAVEAQLDQFRQQAEAERRAAEEALQRLEQEAADNLRRMNEERQQLEAQMEEELAGTAEGLAAAQSEIEKLTEQRNREANLSSQVLGLYLALRESIRENALDRGEQLITQTRNLINSEAYLAVPALRERQSADIFMLDSLERLIQEERRKQATTEELAAQREAEARALEEEAVLEEEALAEAEAEAAAQAEAERQAAQEAAAALVAQAEELMLQGNYVEAASRYVDLLIQYPETPQTEQVPEGIGTILQSYQREIATIQSESSRLAALAEERSGVISTLESRRQTLEEEIANLESAQATQAERVRALEEEARIAQAEWEAAREESARQAEAVLEAEREAALEEGARLAQENLPPPEAPPVDPQLLEEIEKLREIEGTLAGLQERYNRFAGSASAEALDAENEELLLKTKQEFDSFLLSEEAKEIMPGLLERIRIYDRAFEQAGRRTALLDTVELVSELSRLATPAQRLQYLERERANLSEQEMIDFIEELSYLLGQ